MEFRLVLFRSPGDRRHFDDRPAAARDHRGQKGADHPIGRLDVEVKGEIEIRLLGRQYRAGMAEAAAVEEDVGASDLGREGCDRRPVEARKSAVSGRSVSSRLDIGGRGILKKKIKISFNII